ncbi:YsnF/AvaK domain-containing protein [Sphingomonas sp. ID1715]|uniref:YsnF/AvaK domain-containing protein n=1 Tax=Sphingomonas sp. ID1715 TaxID=1656898 RepID=UPI00148978E7|nr:YsnF/AvaK domain-containing protein [Sphingomonas sp. ID1715]NNM76776.1 YsnF/AvaK domain-containing protein [Sphingomonas sp. ID1715]
MSRTITAMFDSRTEAEQARGRLSSSGIEAERVSIIDQESRASGSSTDSSPGQEGFFASLKDLFMPDEDRHAYGEGIRRGGYMLVAEVDEADADRACQLLDDGGSIDFDQRQSEWRNQGWAGHQADRQAGAFGALSGHQETDRTDATMASGNHLGATASGSAEEERIPIVNEELRVGKREVERGGARVRSYVRETPVHEQVNLREEHVEVERRPVSGDYREGAFGGDVFRDREIEMTERAEEAVVSKEARVQEELVVRKTAEERTETIDETVRHTEVDVDKGGSAFGFERDREPGTDERSDFERSGNARDRDDGLL